MTHLPRTVALSRRVFLVSAVAAGGGLMLGLAFPELTGGEVALHCECPLLQKKIQMFHAYESQRPVLESFRPDYEIYRPLADYDFTRPPLPWKLNYEMWGWQMSGAEVAAAFAEYLRAENHFD